MNSIIDNEDFKYWHTQARVAEMNKIYVERPRRAGKAELLKRALENTVVGHYEDAIKYLNPKV